MSSQSACEEALSSGCLDPHVARGTHGEHERPAGRYHHIGAGVEDSAVAPHRMLAQEAHGLAVRLREAGLNHEQVRPQRPRRHPHHPQLGRGLALLVRAGLAKSNGEAVRLLRQRAVRRDGAVLEAGADVRLAASESFVLSVGAARHVRIEVG